ncbi:MULTISPECIES: hypothetical protein [Nocardiopsis]|uniref:Uncharacterized protein n=2 Tax=Nocardiopsis TaxID=2013 RepID=A0A840WNS5_9ACTN|nr:MULTISPECIES: hypothetical protein [Nocardiopsis]MBB5493435.1 hypothetical protein [Nocardiopsis metallicus]MCK9873049.1 hypothetical protein [Nocardiopsis dassonvillei]MEE2052055.1 hypothetical protein [Nocardiopsis umidischolae]
MFTLPHTGMQVPDTRIRVTSLKEVDLGTGIAWSAVVRAGKTKLGTVSNSGRGGPTDFNATTDAAQRRTAAFVAACRDRDGAPMDTENVMETLTEEYEWARDIAKAEKKGRYVVRYADEHGMPGHYEFSLSRGITPPDYAPALKATVRLKLPEGAVRADLWMGPELGWVEIRRPADTTNE